MSVGGEGVGIQNLQVGQGWVVEKSWLGYLHLVHWSLMGVGGIYIYIHVCVNYSCVCIYRGGRCRHIQRRSESGAAIGELMWTQFCLGSLWG